MNCDFLETEYFYNTQHTGQGEKEYNDALSWLKWMSSSEETSHTSLPQSTNPGNSTINDDPSILMSKWKQDDLVIFSWLIQNIEPAIASNLTEFPTAKMPWDALTVTYSSGKDKLQTFDLHVKANGLKQNGAPLEEFWIVIQGIWGEIEQRDPNPMTCPTDIAAYNKIRSANKLFQFLNALDRKYDPIKRKILRWDPLPTAEAAYAAVRKETAHQNILGGKQQGVKLTDDLDGIWLISKGRRSDQKFNSS
nr:putative Gag-polypeptide of LTR copia-type [Tanacetum cinerariifolium]